MADHQGCIFGKLKEHPHVADLRAGFRDAARNAAESIIQATKDDPEQERPPVDVDRLTELLRQNARPVDLITLTGYLGGGNDDAWLRLYPKQDLNRFCIIRKADIVRCERRKSPEAARCEIDVVWLRRDADVAWGRRQPRPNLEEARFIEGGFLAAGDLSAALDADSRRGTSGMFCDAGSPGCCRRPSSSFPR